VSAFYALHDTKTPVKIATVCLVINAVLNVTLMFPMKIGGIALASSIAGAVNCLLLWHGLNKKLNS
jgi:putative peptidoglycan lipid II flippase